MLLAAASSEEVKVTFMLIKFCRTKAVTWPHLWAHPVTDTLAHYADDKIRWKSRAGFLWTALKNQPELEEHPFENSDDIKDDLRGTDSTDLRRLELKAPT
jgi:hypothetical protein